MKNKSLHLLNKYGLKFLLWNMIFSILTGTLLALLIYKPSYVNIYVELQDSNSRTVYLLGDTKPMEKKPLFIPGTLESSGKITSAGGTQKILFSLPEESAARFCLQIPYIDGEGTAETIIKSVEYVKGKQRMSIELNKMENYAFNKNGTLEVLENGSLKLTIDGAYTRFKGQHIAFSQNDPAVITAKYPFSSTQVEWLKALAVALTSGAVFFVLILNIRIFLLGKQGAMRKMRIAWSALVMALTPLVIFAAMELPDKTFSQLASWHLEEEFGIVMLGLGLIYGLYFFLTAAFGPFISAAILGVSGLVLSFVNYNKIQLRAEPVFPWDISNATTFMKVAGETSLLFTYRMLVALVMVLLALAANFACKNFVAGWAASFSKIRQGAKGTQNRLKNMAPFAVRVAAIAVVFGILAWYTDTYFLDRTKQAILLPAWNVPAAYSKQSLAATFTSQFQTYIVPPPEGYSKQAIEDIITQVTGSEGETATQIKPNILMVMSESFWDIEKELPGIEYDRNLYPNLRKMQETAVSGELLVPVFGGGTVFSEFAALTGFNNKYHTQAPPYSNIVVKPFFSLAEYYSSHGYQTMAMHSMPGKNYTRNIAYPYLGFQETWFGTDDYTFPKDKRSRGAFISDELFADKISEQFTQKAQQEKPLFLFAVTLQNHATYSAEKYPPAEPVAFKGNNLSPEFVDGMADMASTLYAVDKSLGELVSFVENQTEPTILIYFGDHMSTVVEDWETMYTMGGAISKDSSETEKVYARFRTPFIAYSNYQDLKQDAGLISINLLMPYVLDTYGLEMPEYFKFLAKEVMPVSPGATAFGLYLHKDGTYSETATPEESKVYQELEMIQYDYFNGKKYGAKLFE